MSFRSRLRGSLPYVAAAVAGFGLAFLIVAFFIFPAGVVPRDVKVPNVTGLTFDDAVQRLAQAGFKAEKGEERIDNSSPKLTVLGQTPMPGTKDAVGSTISLVVSGGQRVVAVPAATGMTKIEAQTLLEQQGFEIGDVTESASDQPRGTVLSTRPAAGAKVSVPSTIALVLSAGAPDIQMPDLAGRDVDAARQTLTQLGIRTVNLVYDPMAVAPNGSVVGQSPAAGTVVQPGSSVQIRVAGTAKGTTP